MRPADLTESSFSSYPPLARKLAVEHLALFRQLPLNLLGSLLNELVSFDWRFPVERAAIEQQLRLLQEASDSQRNAWIAPFSRLPLDEALYGEPWAAHPAQFIEKLTAYLWSVHAIDAYRDAAKNLGDSLLAESPPSKEARWCFIVIGRDAHRPYPDLFRQLRSKGTLFTKVDAEGAWQQLIKVTQQRASAQPGAYAHWYVDGDVPSSMPTGSPVCTVSYRQLEPLREEILRRMHKASTSGTVGPESLRSLMAQMRPADLEQSKGGEADPVLDTFKISLLTEGSGTQIFSTTFVQWAGREILRRAQPSTLLMRFAPRQVDRPMNDLLLPTSGPAELDPEGSLLDGNMGAYYTWLSLQRLPGAPMSRFLAWRETGQEAVVVAPGMAAGTRSSQPCSMAELLAWMA